MSSIWSVGSKESGHRSKVSFDEQRTSLVSGQSQKFTSQSEGKRSFDQTSDLLYGVKYLQYLSIVDAVIIEKIPKSLESKLINESLSLPFVYRSAFNLFSKSGEHMYYAFEESSSFTEKFNPRGRPFKIHLTDLQGESVATFTRKLSVCHWSCCSCCVPVCCHDHVTVFVTSAQINDPVGSVRSRRTCCKGVYDIIDEGGQEKYKLVGTRWPGCAKDKSYRINTKGLKECIGKVTDGWRGVRIEKSCTIQGHFGVVFPDYEKTEIKLTLVAATFLIHCKIYDKGVDHPVNEKITH